MNRNHHDSSSYSNRNAFQKSFVTKTDDQHLIQQHELATTTANENNKPTTLNVSLSHDHDEEYPTSKTIPFPFSSGPYPQQAALMDALLSTLKLVDESHTDSLSDDDDAGGNKSDGIASVMLLESPTGQNFN